MREHPDRTTIAYMAMGVSSAMQLSKKAQHWNAPEGELEFVDSIIEHALMLDTLADEVDRDEGFSGVFLYEVAEPFGKELALRAINGLDLEVETLAVQLIKEASR